MGVSQSRKLRNLALVAAVLMLAFAVSASLPLTARANVSGAVYTTDATDSAVNINQFADKTDVYLSGGPRPPSCSSPGLEDGTYYFQVTDPSGAMLLSTDPLDCRVVTVVNGEVNAYGPAAAGCTAHLAGTPVSLCPGYDRITVQLAPFDNTDNNGGEYKMWMTPIGDVAAGCDPTTTGAGCFVDGSSKTDNFKINGTVTPPPTQQGEIDVLKFCDANANGLLDPSEVGLGIENWPINFDGAASSCSGFTDVNGLLICAGITLPASIDVSEGSVTGYTHSATCVAGVCGACSVDGLPCGSTVDCAQVPSVQVCTPNPPINPVTIDLTSPTVEQVDFGNISEGSITGSKFADNNANGVDNSEPGIAGLKVVLTGTQTSGQTVSLCTTTDANGNYSFSNLLAGTYTATEMPPTGTIQTTPSSCSETLSLTTSTCTVSTAQCAAFGNTCKGAGGGLTLGFWSNKNGQALETQTDFAALTALNLVNANGSARDFTGTLSQNKSALNSWLLNANAVNMAYMLSAQLTAMELNVAHSKVNGGALVFAGTAPAGCSIPGLSTLGFISVSNLMSDANAELAPPGNVTGAGNPERACQEFKKDALDNANNNLNFVVNCPASFNQTCPAAVVASRHKRRHR